MRYLLGDEFQCVYGFRGAREDFEACHVSSGLLPDDVTKLLQLFVLLPVVCAALLIIYLFLALLRATAVRR